MSTLSFTVLYTAQKAKKAKTWHDGQLQFCEKTSKASLLDEKGWQLEKKFVQREALKTGNELEFDRHFITIEREGFGALENNQSLSTVPKTTSRPVAIRRSAISKSALSLAPLLAKKDEPPQKKAARQAVSRQIEHPVVEGRESIKHQFTVMYKAAKTTKTGAWCDGSAAYFDVNHKLVLYDMNQRSIDSLFLRTLPVAGTEVDMDRHLVIIDQSAETTAAEKAEPLVKTSGSTSNRVIKPILTIPLRPKRKRVPSEPIGASPADSPNHPSHVLIHGYAQISTAQGVPKETIYTEALRLAHKKTFTVPSNRFVAPIVSLRALRFPSAKECASYQQLFKMPQRIRHIPDIFPNVEAYCDAFLSAIYEHLQVMVSEIACRYHKLATTKHNGDFETQCRRDRIGMHTKCAIRYANQFKDRNRPVLLTCENRLSYSKDDLWVISTDRTFSATKTFFARSVYHGISNNRGVELAAVCSMDGTTIDNFLCETEEMKDCFAIRLFGCTEFIQIDFLENSVLNVPIIDYLANPVLLQDDVKKPLQQMNVNRSNISTNTAAKEMPDFAQIPEDKYRAMIASISDQYTLNSDQRCVLEMWALSLRTNTQPVTLVHGVFGSGKSHLISILIIFATSVFEQLGIDCPTDTKYRILVSSNTNVAVDRILLGLLDKGFEEFVRVGSLRKIAKRVLPFTVQSRQNKDLKELRNMLNDNNVGGAERMYGSSWHLLSTRLTYTPNSAVQKAITRFVDSDPQAFVDNTFVVGTTCLATAFEVLRDATFAIVILDECSQMTEPCSLLPLGFGCEHLLCVGDPLQLPPTIETKCAHGDHLDRTMFERLACCGIAPILLRTQYRCHPVIANISNELFYERMLKHGRSSDGALLKSDVDFGRFPIPAAPILAFIDAPGDEVQVSGGSYVNSREVNAVVRIVSALLALGVSCDDLGIIALYKAQAESITQSMETVCGNNKSDGGGSVQVSTVDAFQGAEKAVIIVSCVRSRQIGFSDDHRRINVLLTRAKHHLFIVGNRTLLSGNKLWGTILEQFCQDIMAAQSNGYFPSDTFVRLLKTLPPIPPRKVAANEETIEFDDSYTDGDNLMAVLSASDRFAPFNTDTDDFVSPSKPSTNYTTTLPQSNALFCSPPLLLPVAGQHSMLFTDSPPPTPYMQIHPIQNISMGDTLDSADLYHLDDVVVAEVNNIEETRKGAMNMVQPSLASKRTTVEEDMFALDEDLEGIE